MFAVGLYNILSLQSFEDFGEPVYITGGVLFAILGIAKIALSILGIIAMALEWKIPMVIVSQKRGSMTHTHTCGEISG